MNHFADFTTMLLSMDLLGSPEFVDMHLPQDKPDLTSNWR